MFSFIYELIFTRLPSQNTKDTDDNASTDAHTCKTETAAPDPLSAP